MTPSTPAEPQRRSSRRKTSKQITRLKIHTVINFSHLDAVERAGLEGVENLVPRRIYDLRLVLHIKEGLQLPEVCLRGFALERFCPSLIFERRPDSWGIARFVHVKETEELRKDCISGVARINPRVHLSSSFPSARIACKKSSHHIQEVRIMWR